MFEREAMAVNLDGLRAGQPPARAWAGFEHQRLETALGQVQGRAQAGNAAANDDCINGLFHGLAPREPGQADGNGFWKWIRRDRIVFNHLIDADAAAPVFLGLVDALISHFQQVFRGFPIGGKVGDAGAE